MGGGMRKTCQALPGRFSFERAVFCVSERVDRKGRKEVKSGENIVKNLPIPTFSYLQGRRQVLYLKMQTNPKKGGATKHG